MDYTIKILIFIVVFFIQVKYDYNLYSCKSLVAKLIILFHHLISIYLFLGSILFDNHLIHLIFILIGLITHKFFGKCGLTTYTNKLCFNKDGKNKPFITILNHLSNRYEQKNIKEIYYPLLILIIIYDLYFINKKYKILKI